jgi:hypothetical protein
VTTYASDIVQDALFACGALGQGDDLKDADAQLVLRRFNRLLDSWSNVKTLCYELLFDTGMPTVAGTASYSSTLLTNGRPVRVDTIAVSRSSFYYDVELISQAQWSAIPYRLTQGVPEVCWIDWGYPNATFNFYPIPDAVYTVNVGTRKKLTSGYTLTTALSVPPGYERAFVDVLAVDIAGSFGRPITAAMAANAREAQDVLRVTNLEVPLLDSGFGGGLTPLEAIKRG